MRESPTISVIGLGYVGIVQAVCLADRGLTVIGVDRDPDRLAALARGESPFAEPGLAEMLERAVGSGRLRFAQPVEEALAESRIGIICVDTPTSADGASDLGALGDCLDFVAAARSSQLEDFGVVIRSTIPVGTMGRLVVPRFSTGSQGAVCLFIPEFLREGNALHDHLHPQKILVGCRADDDRTREIVTLLYGGVSARHHFVSHELAELAKYTENGWHALKICFANEIGALSSAFGVDGRRLMELFRLDTKLNISDAYLKPGMPFGGSCLAKDLAALVHTADEADLALPLLASVISSNDRHLERCVTRVLRTGHRRIGLWGVSFKAGTNDLRNSPGVALLERLLVEGCQLAVHDETMSPEQLSDAFKTRHPACHRAFEEGRLRIDGLAGLDDCEVLVLCHAPQQAVNGRAGQMQLRLYQ
jgi:GDP-mannose 6-dehydrogenase